MSNSDAGDLKSHLKFRDSGMGYNIRSIPQGHTQDVADHHYYLKAVKGAENGSCQDMRKTPPIYFYGGRPSVKGNVVDILGTHKSSGAAVAGLDCSAFVSTALIAAGLKITPKSTTTQLVSSGFTALGGNGKDCFDRPEFTPGSSLYAGDIVSWNGHVFMIDSAGIDPLGIEKAKREGRFPKTVNECNRFSVRSKDLDFVIIQSTGYGDVGVMKMQARDYVGNSVSWSHVNELAIQACKAEFQGSAQGTFKTKSGNVSTNLIRHRGKEVEGCVMKPEERPQLKGESCIDQCFAQRESAS
jgi:hypothetical protein